MFEAYRKFFKFAGTYRTNWYKAVVLEIVRCICEAVQFIPLFIILKSVIENTMTIEIVWFSLALMVASIVGQAIVYYLGHSLEIRSCYLMCDDKRIQIGERMKYMPMGYFNSHSLGNITAVCTSTMEDLESMAGAVVVRILAGIIHALVFSLAFMLFDWRIGIIYFTGVLVFLFVNSRMLAMSRAHSPQRLAAQMKLVDAVLEFIQGMSVVKAFHLDKQANTTIEKTIDETERQNFKLEKKGIPYTILQQCVLRLFSVIAVLVSIALCLSGSMPVFTCLLIVISAFMVYGQIEVAGSVSFMLPMIDASIDRVEEINETPIMDTGVKDIVPKEHSIAFDHVGFSYADRRIIDDVSLSIPEKTTCAIVGPSGSGKTTLTSLMARFWDVDEGTIKLGGIDVRDYKLDSLMASFSMVFQGVYLFNDTIENNIKFGDPDATHEEVIAAAQAARCHDFITALPDGYDTVLGESGATVSGGEKQRISIARAILKGAPVIILDEATANVDPENEAELQAAIEALIHDKTIVMIAHRLKTVRHADQILVVDGGHIVQRGTHDELMTAGGLYADFVNTRTRAIGWKITAGAPAPS